MTILAVWNFIKSPIGRYIGLAILAVGLFLGLRSHFIHQGQLEGKQEAATQFSKQLEDEKAADRKATAEHIAADNVKDQAINQQLVASAAALQSSNQALAVLAKARQDALNQVQGLKDGELHPFIVGKLGLRPAGDLTPGYSPAEERAIATAVVDDKNCQAAAVETDKKFKALSDTVDQLNKKVQNNEDKFNTLAGYTDRLEGYYTQAYNMIPKRGPRLWFTLGLVRGKAKQLSVPEPGSLTSPVKKEVK